MSHLAFFAHANVFHHGGQPIPIELSIARIPEDGTDPKPPARICTPRIPVFQEFCHLAQGNRGLIVVKVSDQRKMFEKLGLFRINLEILPHFRDLNDRSLPDHLHDEVHENFDTSECTMVKSYRFARYLQHFNKLQAECKRQTAYLVESSTAGSDVVQSGRPIFDDFFQHLWPYIGNNTANVVFQMVKRLWLIRIDQ
ncbi:hypothetical protein TNCV_2382311 [Trichonephila clavipes]|nr:hypothetical protein TNCV_2382311 [Trichonephila clavipes]